MKIAILSDVHGNITALDAVLNDIKKRNITKIFCLGDYVTKCTHPDLVIDRLRNLSVTMLIGNCDYTICASNSRALTYWSRRIIGEERAEFVRNLPVSCEFYLSGHLIRLFHASPYKLNEIFNPMYSNKDNSNTSLEITSPERLFENTKYINKFDNDPIPDIVGYGHIHTPCIFRYKNKTLFNTGSVGVPVEMSNDSNTDPTSRFSTMSSYIILEGKYDSKTLSSISFNHIRIPYNIQQEVLDLENSDMPDKNKIIKSLLYATPNL